MQKNFWPPAKLCSATLIHTTTTTTTITNNKLQQLPKIYQRIQIVKKCPKKLTLNDVEIEVNV